MCSLHTQRGDSVCKNDLRIQRQQLEDRRLAGLQNRVLREDLIDYAIAGLQEEIRERHSAFDSWLKALREEKQRIEMELKRLVEMIATGSGSQSVMAANHRARSQTPGDYQPSRGARARLGPRKARRVARIRHFPP